MLFALSPHHPPHRTTAHRSTRPLIAVALLLGVLPWSTPRAVTATTESPSKVDAPAAARLARCRGSTRAQVTVAWPTPGDIAIDSQLHWGTHVPDHIRRWAYLIVPNAAAAGVDPYLVAAVMHVESHGDPLAWNLDSDAHGLMQVLHASWQPATNISVGVAMLGSLIRQFGRQDLALAGYNAGPGNVQRYGGIPPFPETRNYVVLVTYYRDLFAGVHLSSTRTAAFHQAAAALVAFKQHVCNAP